MRSESAGKQYGKVRTYQKWRPQHCGPNGEMVVEMTRYGAEDVPWIALGVQPGLAETLVRVLIICREIQIVLYQRSPRKRVITDTVAAHPWIYQGQRNDQQEQEYARSKSRLANCLGLRVVQTFQASPLSLDFCRTNIPNFGSAQFC